MAFKGIDIYLQKLKSAWSQSLILTVYLFHGNIPFNYLT